MTYFKLCSYFLFVWHIFKYLLHFFIPLFPGLSPNMGPTSLKEKIWETVPLKCTLIPKRLCSLTLNSSIDSCLFNSDNSLWCILAVLIWLCRMCSHQHFCSNICSGNQLGNSAPDTIRTQGHSSDAQANTEQVPREPGTGGSDSRALHFDNSISSVCMIMVSSHHVYADTHDWKELWGISVKMLHTQFSEDITCCVTYMCNIHVCYM